MQNDLPVIVQIVTNILQIADVAAIPQAKAAGAQAQAELLAQKIVAQYKAGTNGTTLQDVNSAFQVVNTDINAILSAVHIDNTAKQAAISAGIGVALSTLLAIESLIPALSGGQAAKVRLSPRLPRRSSLYTTRLLGLSSLGGKWLAMFNWFKDAVIAVLVFLTPFARVKKHERFRNVKSGRCPARFNRVRRLLFQIHFANLPPAPASVKWSQGVASWGPDVEQRSWRLHNRGARPRHSGLDPQCHLRDADPWRRCYSRRLLCLVRVR